MHLLFSRRGIKIGNRAISLWEEVLQEGESMMQIEACIELAKIYEHKLRKYMKAIQYTEKAIEIQIKEKKDKQLVDLEKRFTRLTQKTSLFKRINMSEICHLYLIEQELLIPYCLNHIMIVK